ncbi:nicotinate-nucleotide pyrophosphorylase, partial [Gloeomargarita lithophora Alchichica-D10]
PIVIPLDL